MKKLINVSMLLFLLLGMIPFTTATAQTTLTVNNSTDDNDGSCDASNCSLREAVNAAISGDTIAFAESLSGSTITLDGHIWINKSLTIVGPGADQLTISGGEVGHYTLINEGDDVGGVFWVRGAYGDDGVDYISVNISGLTIMDGRARDGGGIHNGSRSTLEMTDCVIGPNNEALEAGGGISNKFGTLTLNRCTVRGNSQSGGDDPIGGGGIATINAPATTTLINSTVSGNEAYDYGGGILSWSSAEVNLSHTTVTDNAAWEDGGGVAIGDSGTVQSLNSILAGNFDLSSAETDSNPDVFGTFTSLGGNLIGDGTGSSGWDESDKVGTATSPLYPMLGALTVNEPGKTPTMALLEGSPAIDAAPTCEVTIDQRGVTRPQGSACDIGAYELVFPSIIVNSKEQQSDTTTVSCTLGAAIQAANTDSAVDGCPAGNGDDTIILPVGQYDLTTAAVTGSGVMSLGLPRIESNITIVGELMEDQPVSIIKRDSSEEFCLMQVANGYRLNLESVELTGGKSNTAAIDAGSESTVTLSHVKVTGNESTYNSAINVNGSLTIEDSNLLGNKGGVNGAVFAQTLIVSRSTFENNQAIGGSYILGTGGAIFSYQLSITDSTFKNNSGNFGGAISLPAEGESEIIGSLFVNNSASNNGGGIFSDKGNLTIINSTFTGNTVASYSGGAIYKTGGDITLLNVTLSGNGAPNGGNLYFTNNTVDGVTTTFDATLTNTILANPSTGDNCFTYDVPSRFIDGGGNLLTSVCDGVTSTIGDPVLESLADNGGPTQTMALGATSKALEIGVPDQCPVTDQRGVTRPQPVESTNCDAGAYESELTPQTDTSPPELIGLPEDMTVEAESASGAIVSYTPPTATDDYDPDPSVECLPGSGSTFSLGVNTVTCTATDNSGNQSSGEFKVTVQDTTPPVIDPHDNVTAEATSATGAIVTYTSPVTSDAVDGPGTASCDPISGSQFALGDTTVTCNATDAAGNAATPTNFTVQVVDTTPPVVTVPENMTVTATDEAGAVVEFEASAIDLVDGTVAHTCNPVSGSEFPLGTTEVTCTATDTEGNTGQASFFVTVEAQTVVGISQLTSARTKCSDFVAGTASDVERMFFTTSYNKKTGEDFIKKVSPSSFLYYVKVTLPAGDSVIQITQAVTGNTSSGFPFMTPSVTLYDESCARLSPLLANVTIESDDLITITVEPGEAERIIYIAVKYTAKSLSGQVVDLEIFDVTYIFSAALNGPESFTSDDLPLMYAP